MKTAAPVKESQVESAFQRRAARARQLAGESDSAKEPLLFAEGLYRAQASLAGALAAGHAVQPFSGHLESDAGRVFDGAREILRFAAREGPPALADEATARQDEEREIARTRLLVYWEGGRSAAEDYLSRAMLRPFVELLRSANVAPNRVHRRGQCPFCSGGPWISARRDGSTMEGARRMLGCSLCGGEWLFGRILCPSCFEENPEKLPAFQSERHSAVRLEACETCRRYIKSIDLSEDARPIPEVDDLASLPMDLWALEQGYTRIEPGLAGV